MKKKLLMSAVVAALLICLSAGVGAAGNATVEFTDGQTLEYSDVSSAGSNVSFGDSFNGMYPGETRSVTIDIKNSNDNTADFYLSTEAIEALESANNSSGGAYTISLNVTSGGSTSAIYNSEVGGATSASGIKEINDSSIGKDRVYLSTLAKGESASLVLSVGLDGESVTNKSARNYSNAVGQIGLNFAVAYDSDEPEIIEKVVEIPRNRHVVRYVNTGDATAIGAMAVVLAVGIVVFILTGKKRKSEVTADEKVNRE